jgi:hypothetical protein
MISASRLLVGAIAGVLAAGTIYALAHAKPANKAKVAAKASSVDIAGIADSLLVLRANDDHYVAVLPFELDNEHFYYGKRGALHRQRTLITSTLDQESFERVFWSPNGADGAGVLRFRRNAWTLDCGDSIRTLVPVAAAEKRSIVTESAFHTPKWKRRAHLLARDDSHRYYYIDRRVDAEGTEGFQLYQGRKGKLRRVPLREVIRDTEGEIFVTAKGEIRVGRDPDNRRRVEWARGQSSKDLVPIPVGQNARLIYRELGVYRSPNLGTACD